LEPFYPKLPPIKNPEEPYVYTDPRPAAQAFRKTYVSMFKREPTQHSGANYDGTYILKEAIEKAGLDGAKVRDFIHNLKRFQRAQGIFNFDKNGDCGYFQCVIQTKGLVPHVLKQYGYE
jgi:branched-chain amino acid transport system substrate-binding protein